MNSSGIYFSFDFVGFSLGWHTVSDSILMCVFFLVEFMVWRGEGWRQVIHRGLFPEVGSGLFRLGRKNLFLRLCLLG